MKAIIWFDMYIIYFWDIRLWFWNTYQVYRKLGSGVEACKILRPKHMLWSPWRLSGVKNFLKSINILIKKFLTSFKFLNAQIYWFRISAQGDFFSFVLTWYFFILLFMVYLITIQILKDFEMCFIFAQQLNSRNPFC